MSKIPEAITESFRRVALFLATAVKEQDLSAVLFAGPQGGEGTTTTTVRVARQLRASFGLRPLVVELGQKNPVMCGVFRLDRSRSVEAIAAGRPVGECVQLCSDGLEVIPAMGQAGNNGQMIAVDMVLRRVLDATKKDYDIVLVDAPPVLVYADVVIAGTVIPNLMLVVQAGRTRHEVIDRIRHDLSAKKIKILGAILNRHRRFLPGWLYRMIT